MPSRLNRSKRSASAPSSPVDAGDRLDVLKTFKLFINGQFPRSESGRTEPVSNAKGVLAHVSRASRKDLRDAVEAARAASAKWEGMTAYNRGQILYRMAEMLEGKRGELEAALASLPAPRTTRAKGAAPKPAAEVDLAIDRLVHFAGWTDKLAQVLGGQNPVAGAFYAFTVPEPTGVVAVVAPDAPPLLGLISLLAPALAGANTTVVLAGSGNPLVAALLGEICATSDVPPGVVNILTGQRSELLPFIAAHRDIDAVHAAGLSADESALLRGGSAENLKRVVIRHDVNFADADACEGPAWIEPLLEFKSIWHPSAS